MAEYWTCAECESPFDESDGDLDERLCHKCINIVYAEYSKVERRIAWPVASGSDTKKDQIMKKVDQLINWLKGLK